MLNDKNRIYGKTKNFSVEDLKVLFRNEKLDYLSVVLLFGSRADGTATRQSDYDFAVAGDSKDAPFGIQAKSWIDISMLMDVSEYDIDVVDLTCADKLLKSSIAEQYIILKGEPNEVSRLLG